jgi:hypothetical protein
MNYREIAKDVSGCEHRYIMAENKTGNNAGVIARFSALTVRVIQALPQAVMCPGFSLSSGTKKIPEKSARGLFPSS